MSKFDARGSCGYSDAAHPLEGSLILTRILVVDDDLALREVLAMVLEDEGYAVDTAANGAEALSTVARTQPAVVVTDIMMPVMDGLALFQALSADPVTAHLPVVMTSAGSNRSTLEGLRFAAFLPKPMNFTTLLRVLAALTDDMATAG